jgi:AcrR family transcriptional regulator
LGADKGSKGSKGSKTSAAKKTQGERLAASRQRILDAAVLSLAERGYASTTFAEVLARAELSNGALWRHFRTKTDLLGAAALYAQEQIAAWPDDEAASLDNLPPARRLDAAVDHFWRSAHQPEFQALIELLRASRSDTDLAEQLMLTDEGAAKLFFDVFARLVGDDLARHPQFRRNGRVLGLTLYGIGLTTGLRPAPEEARVLADLRDVLRLLFGIAAAR